MRKIGHFLKQCFGDIGTLKEFFKSYVIVIVAMALIPMFFLMANNSNKPRIGTVNITSIVDHFVKSQVSLNLATPELNARVKTFGTKLEGTLHAVAQTQQVVLLPTEAVIAGGVDYTPMVNQLLKQP